MAAMTIEQLTAVGGKEWVAGDKHRIYFNNLSELYGVETTRYNSGHISSATLDGEDISNNKAFQLLTMLNSAKFWFDIPTMKFWNRGLNADDFQKVIAAVRARVAALDVPVPNGQG